MLIENCFSFFLFIRYRIHFAWYRSLEETADRLRKEAHSARQEEEGLMNDVETTGQAFEEMQEQNTRLLQQLREKVYFSFKKKFFFVLYNKNEIKVKII